MFVQLRHEGWFIRAWSNEHNKLCRAVKSHAFGVRLTHFGLKLPLTPARVAESRCLTHFTQPGISPKLLDPQESMAHQSALGFDGEAISGLHFLICTKLICLELIVLNDQMAKCESFHLFLGVILSDASF